MTESERKAELHAEWERRKARDLAYTSENSALAQYKRHLDEMEGLAHRIEKALTQMRKDMVDQPGSIHWGHVGDAADMHQKLQDFVDQAYQEGEYAQEAEGETR